MAMSVGELVAMLRADTRNFDRPVDQAGRRFGRFADMLRRGVSAAANTMRNLGSGIANVTQRYLPGLHSAVGRFRDGFRSADAAASAFSGRMGTLGGVASRALGPPLAGLGRFRDGFMSSGAAASAFSGRMGTLGGVARSAVDGVGRAARGMGSAFTAAAGAASAGIARMRDGLGGMAGQAAGLVAAVGIGAFASSVFSLSNSLIEARAQFTAITGSAATAGDMMDRISNIAKGSTNDHKAFLDMGTGLAYVGVTGDQAEKVMRNVDLAATAAGSGTQAFESTTLALTKALNRGKVSLEDIQMISNQGIPIFEALGQTLNATTGEVMEMTSAGKLSVDDLVKALETAGGDTFDKYRAGAELMGQSVPEQFARIRTSVTSALAETAVPLMERAGQSMAGFGDRVEDGIGRLPEVIGTAKAAMDQWGITEALHNIVERLREIGEVAGPFLIGVVQGLGIAFGVVVHAVSMFLDFISPLTDYLRENTGIMQGLGIAVGVLSGFFVAGKIAMIGLSIAATLLGPAIKALGVIWRILSSTWMIGALKIAAGWLVAMGPIGWIGIAIAALVALIIYYWDDIKAWTISTWSAITEWISNAWSTIVSTVTGWIDRVNQITVDGWNRVRDWTSNAWSAVVDFVRNAWSRIVETVRSWIARANQFTVDGWNRAREMTSSAWSSLVSTISSWISRAIDWVRGIPGRVMSALGNIGSLLIGSGRALVDGFLSGIRNAWGRITSFVKDGMSKLRNLWPFSPAKEGPFSGRGYVTHSGKALTSDFAESLRKGMPGVIEQARALTEAAHAELTPNLPALRMSADLPGDSRLARDRDRDRDRARERRERERQRREQRGPSADEIADAVRAGVHAGLDKARMQVDGRGVAQLVNGQNSRDRRLGGTRNPAPTGGRGR